MTMAIKERMEDFYFEVELPDGTVEFFSSGEDEGEEEDEEE